MKVRMKTQVFGLINGQRWPAPGEVIDLPDVAALKEIKAGRAEAVVEKSDTDVETRPAPGKRETRKS